MGGGEIALLFVNEALIMVLQRSQQPRYPLHRTHVTKRIRTCVKKTIQSNDDGRSDQEDDNGFESPFFKIGRLVDFHIREDHTRMYTIKWDIIRRKDKNVFVNEIHRKSGSGLPLESQSGWGMPCANTTGTELWTEARVTIGKLLNQSMGLKVAKRFETGIFIGHVSNVYANGSQNDGKVFYHIEYGDGDSEDFNEKEFQEGVALYCQMQKQQKKEKEEKQIRILLNRSRGLKIAKRFETGNSIGHVTNVYASENKNDKRFFYQIEYGDRDSENFDENELQEGVALYCHVQKQQTKRRKLLDQNIGVKVAKYFEAGLFTGQVKNVRASDNQGNEWVLYHIEYEDGDSEDFDEKELQEGVALYWSLFRKQNKQTRKDRKEKKAQLGDDVNCFENKNSLSHSFEALYDRTTPIHTLILGTHPGRMSLGAKQYFAHPANAFWWIAGDCLGFRRDIGETKGGGLRKLCADLRYDESYIIPYEKQIDIFCQNGFALWDILASCERKGSLDRDIQNDKPNDIKSFVEQNPTIQSIVFANGKKSFAFFNRHFSKWVKSGKLIQRTSHLYANKQVGVGKSDTISYICALSVSPAATITYKEKRDFWDEFVYSPGLKLHQQLATAKKKSH